MGSEDDIGVDVGDYVSVTGDRGVDIGRVVHRKSYVHPDNHPFQNQSFPLVLNKVGEIEVRLLKDQVCSSARVFPVIA